MLLVVLIMVFGGVIGRLFDGESYGAGTVIGVVVGLLGGVMIALAFGESSKRLEIISTHSLGSLHNSSSLEGSFFLGCGTIGTNPYYVYFEEAADGGYVYRRKRADYGDAVVYEENRTNGVIEYCKMRPPAWMWTWLVFWEGQEVYRFRIPKGSIKKEFTL